MSFKVYWTEAGSPRSTSFSHEEMAQALAECERQRARKKAGEDVSFISLVAENPECVGQMGVDVTGPDYEWKKRR